MSSGREEEVIMFLTNMPVEASRRHTSVWEQGSNSHHYPWILLVQLDSWYKQGYVRKKTGQRGQLLRMFCRCRIIRNWGIR